MPVTTKWSESDIPDQSGRTVLITGANSGLGLRNAKVLAEKGARVLLACRSAERGAQALDAVKALAHTKPELIQLDLADLNSVRNAAADARELTGDRLDVLVNNAGLFATPRAATADGVELQFGTNTLGPAALTWLLMPALRGGNRARSVMLTSVAALIGGLDLTDVSFEHRPYNPAVAYGQTKLANQVFGLELDRRLRAADEDVISVLAAPGYTATNLGHNMARAYHSGIARATIATLFRLGDGLIAQNPRMGTLPQLYAETAPGVNGGDYIGPSHFQMRGHPTFVNPLRPALDHGTGSALYELVADLTGVTPDPA